MTEPFSKLHASILAARSADPATSKTAKLFRDGIAKMAKKVAEEAVEVGLDAVRGKRSGVINESADLFYNLAVLWAEVGIDPEEVFAEIERREQVYGIAEKLPKFSHSKSKLLTIALGRP